MPSLYAKAKAIVPLPLKRFIVDHVYDPARVFRPQPGFPAVYRADTPFAEHFSPGCRVAFHHIPKTAGSSFRRMLEAMYPRREICPEGHADGDIRNIPPDRFSQYRLICGHVTIDLLAECCDGAAWLVFLRDPIARAVSHHHQAVYRDRQSADWKRWATARAPVERFMQSIENMPLDEFLALDAPQALGMTHNTQTNFLTERAFRKQVGNPRCLGFDRRILDRAKDNLARRYAFVGVQEDFDRSLDLFGATFGLGPRARSFSANVSPERASGRGPAISDNARRILEDRNPMDLELHRFACALVEERAAALGL